ncbi:trehalose synthase [Candidatus Dojkabacteria bacterium]|uniref:Alpha-amylase n=1 Tax=Candidatus Dojkabacteria bacterium TaxID=2099670 RepID=A0A955RI49_9BACT|nr:trehalose synthase [Candidatus Dojkabacteria bacterium]
MASNKWWKDAIIYELYIDKFADDLKGLTRKLDYLSNLGVNCIWILPHYPSPMVDDGYDISDYKSVRENLGTVEDFQEFLDKAHLKGIRVITDLVLNHTSSKHPWFIEASSSKDNPKRDYYLWSDDKEKYKEGMNAFPQIKPENWIFNAAANDYYYATFYPEQPDLNWDNKEVVSEMLEVMKFWLDMGVDGFRLDAIPHMIKVDGTDCYNQPKVHELVKEIRKFIDSNYSDRILLAEAYGFAKDVKKYFGNDDECRMAFNFNLMNYIYLALAKGDDEIARKVAEETFDIPEDCQWATFLRNHDELALSFLPEDDVNTVLDYVDPERKFMFRSGDTSVRLATAMQNDKTRILKAFELLLTLPGSPVIYYGSELGMQNENISPPPLDTRRYVRGKIDWNEAEKQMKDEDSIYNGVKRMIVKR